jgi:hypothetical protein
VPHKVFNKIVKMTSHKFSYTHKTHKKLNSSLSSNFLKFVVVYGPVHRLLILGGLHVYAESVLKETAVTRLEHVLALAWTDRGQQQNSHTV